VKQTEHIKEANDIGNNSYQLLNFAQLPKDASAEAQVEALKQDATWQENHASDVMRSIDRLIRKIEESNEQ